MPLDAFLLLSRALSQSCNYGVLFHPRCPRFRRRPRFSVGFMDGCSTFDQQFNQLSSSPTACPSQRCGFEQIISQVPFGSLVEQHRCEPRTIFISYWTVVSGREMQGGLTETFHIWVNPMPQQHGHAPEVASVFRGVSPGTTDWLNENPMPARVASRPTQVRERQFDNLRTPMIACGPARMC